MMLMRAAALRANHLPGGSRISTFSKGYRARLGFSKPADQAEMKKKMTS